MADHLLQMHVLQERSILLAHFDPLIDHLVQDLGLLTSLMPHAHGIVHGNDRHHACHCKNGRVNTHTASGCNDHGTDRCAVGTGHTAITPHAFQLELAQQDKIDDGFKHLRHKPAEQ